MKILTLCTVMLFALCSLSFAIDINSDDGSSIGGGLYKPSTKVIVSFLATTSDYSAGAKHEQGTKGYVTTSADPKIDSFDCAAGTTTKVTISAATTLGTACE